MRNGLFVIATIAQMIGIPAYYVWKARKRAEFSRRYVEALAEAMDCPADAWFVNGELRGHFAQVDELDDATLVESLHRITHAHEYVDDPDGLIAQMTDSGRQVMTQLTDLHGKLMKTDDIDAVRLHVKWLPIKLELMRHGLPFPDALADEMIFPLWLYGNGIQMEQDEPRWRTWFRKLTM